MTDDNIPPMSVDDSEHLAQRVSDIVLSGLPLAAGLSAAADEAPNRRIGQALRSLSKSVERGESLPDALEAATSRLPTHVAGLIRASIQTGQFGKVLGDLVQHHHDVRRLRRSVWSALAYPLALLLITLAVLIPLHIYVVRNFEDLFREFELSLPPITIAVIWWSELIWHFLLAAAAATVLCIVVRVIFGLAGLTALWQRMYSTVPLIGPLSHWSGVAEWARVLGVLLEQQIPLTDSLRLAADAVSDLNVRQVSRQLADDVQQGRVLSQSLSSTHRLPALVSALAAWGEHGATLPDAMRTLSEMYTTRVRLRAAVLRPILPPLMFVAVGLTIGFVIVGLFLPLIELLNNLVG